MVIKMIKLLVCDVDGTLTDGAIVFEGTSGEHKSFSVKDGLILKLLPKLGIDVLFLTGRSSEAVARRASDLGATAIQGVDDKVGVLGALMAERSLTAEECAYIGDDFNDYAAMKLCGFKACPADAVDEIKGICDYVSCFPGGYGAVRNICEHLLENDGKYGEFLKCYGIG